MLWALSRGLGQPEGEKFQEYYGNRATLRRLISNSVHWQGLSVTVKLNIVYQLVYG